MLFIMGLLSVITSVPAWSPHPCLGAMTEHLLLFSGLLLFIIFFFVFFLPLENGHSAYLAQITTLQTTNPVTPQCSQCQTLSFLGSSNRLRCYESGLQTDKHTSATGKTRLNSFGFMPKNAIVVLNLFQLANENKASSTVKSISKVANMDVYLQYGPHYGANYSAEPQFTFEHRQTFNFASRVKRCWEAHIDGAALVHRCLVFFIVLLFFSSSMLCLPWG